MSAMKRVVEDLAELVEEEWESERPEIDRETLEILSGFACLAPRKSKEYCDPEAYERAQEIVDFMIATWA